MSAPDLVHELHIKDSGNLRLYVSPRRCLDVIALLSLTKKDPHRPGNARHGGVAVRACFAGICCSPRRENGLASFVFPAGATYFLIPIGQTHCISLIRLEVGSDV
jgi:hypothetical protein